MKPIPAILKYDQSVKRRKLHRLPFNIKYNGKSNVNKFFKVKKDDNENEKIYSSSFRGVELKGRKVRLPKSCKGLVVKQSDANMAAGGSFDSQHKILSVSSDFKSFISWEREKPPKIDDSIHNLLLWTRLAKQIHEIKDNDQQENENENENEKEKEKKKEKEKEKVKEKELKKGVKRILDFDDQDNIPIIDMENDDENYIQKSKRIKRI